MNPLRQLTPESFEAVQNSVKDVDNLLIYGYSAGGAPALDLAESRTTKGRSVESLILVDPLTGGGKHPAPADGISVYDTISNGHLINDSVEWDAGVSMGGSTLQNIKERKRYWTAGHRTVDDVTAVAAVDRINAGIQRIRDRNK